MRCPTCPRHSALQLRQTSEALRVRACPTCLGRWIRSDDYWRWRTTRREESGRGAHFAVSPPEETERPDQRFCPEDGYLLARFETGPAHRFWIEQCRHCSGVWLDSGEWEHLVRAGLAGQLHLILSAEWQDELRAAMRHETERLQWLRQLGEADLARIAEVKEWLDNHPKRSQLYAYLRFHERAV